MHIPRGKSKFAVIWNEVAYGEIERIVLAHVYSRFTSATAAVWIKLPLQSESKIFPSTLMRKYTVVAWYNTNSLSYSNH